MQRTLIAFVAGLVAGACAGLLLSLLVWLSKKLRDSRLHALGVPLPSDRVFASMHVPFAVLGGVLAPVLSLWLDVSPLWAALSLFAFPAACVPVLALSVVLSWLTALDRSSPAEDFDPERLVGLTLGEAQTLLASWRGRYHVVEEESKGVDDLRPVTRRVPGGRPELQLSLRDGRVTRADVT